MDRTQAERMISAIRAAIIDASPRGDDGMLVVNLDAALSALAYVIAAIGVQAKFVETAEKTMAFANTIADAIERDIEGLRGNVEPFAPILAIFRTDQVH
jgi:hypothetical protein